MSKFGLTLRKKEEPKAVQGKSKAAIFEQDSDEEEEKDQSASAKFQRKYANLEKSKDKRMVEKMMAENPDIYDYDGQYEKMQKIKDQKIAEQKEADKDKKPKYAHKIMEAHKKRELEKLLHDEHTYKKEREQEAGEFDDKEVFVTGAYRKQIEERNKFREEIEEQDRMDEMRDVKNQSMWQQAFQRKMLEDRARDYQMDEDEEEAKVKMEPLELKTETEEVRTKNELVEKEVKRKEMEEPIKKRRREEGEQPPPQQQEYKERHQGDRQRRRSRSPKTGTGETEFEPEEKKVQKKSQHLALLPPLDDLTEEVRRMEIIRQILRKRNGPKEIEEARNRYLERREAGEIKPPF